MGRPCIAVDLDDQKVEETIDRLVGQWKCPQTKKMLKTWKASLNNMLPVGKDINEAPNRRNRGTLHTWAFVKPDTKKELFRVQAVSRLQAIFLAKKKHPSMLWLDDWVERGKIEVNPVLEQPVPPRPLAKHPCPNCSRELVTIKRSDGEKVCQKCGWTIE
jgi:predicted RNA-binding Zn-ribbon protein involved in translation (DUF1610 family)